MKLEIPEEPVKLKAFMESLKIQWSGDPRVKVDSFVVWAGNQLPKYLWDEWKIELKNSGFSWQSFLKLLRYKTDDALLWFRGGLLWNDFVKNVINTLEGKFARELNERMKSKTGMNFVQDFFVKVPIYGAANAGAPLTFAKQELLGYVPVSRRTVGTRRLFAIEISGDSLNLAEINGKKIKDNDYVIVDPDAELQNGDLALVVIDNHATVKIFQRDGEQIKLLPHSLNKEHAPIYLGNNDNFVINGKVVDVYKSS